MIDRLKKNIENQAFSKLSKKDKQKGLCCRIQFSTIVCFSYFRWYGTLQAIPIMI